jgi:hypothetical protein
MAGVSEYDFLYKQALIMVDKFNEITSCIVTLSNELVNISDSIDMFQLETILTDLENANTYIDQNNLQVAKDTITNSRKGLNGIKKDRAAKKDKIVKLKATTDPVKVTIAETTGMISELLPMITEAIKAKAGSSNLWYHYECKSCSLKCPFSARFVPPDPSFFPTCFLDGSPVNWSSLEIEGEAAPKN